MSRILQDFDITKTHSHSIDSDTLQRQLAKITKNDLSLESESLIPDIVFFDNEQVSIL